MPCAILYVPTAYRPPTNQLLPKGALILSALIGYNTTVAFGANRYNSIEGGQSSELSIIGARVEGRLWWTVDLAVTDIQHQTSLDNGSTVSGFKIVDYNYVGQFFSLALFPLNGYRLMTYKFRSCYLFPSSSRHWSRRWSRFPGGTRLLSRQFV